MTVRYKIRNLTRFQHYRGENGARPRWVKWYRSSFETPSFMALSDGAKWISILSVFDALDHEDRLVDPDRVEFLARRRVKPSEWKELQTAGFLENSRVSLEDVYTDSRPVLEQIEIEIEIEKEIEKEKERRPDTARVARTDGFDRWWGSLTGRVQENGKRTKGSKVAARKVWIRLDLADRADDVVRGTDLYQQERDRPKDAERILTGELWKQALEEIIEKPGHTSPAPIDLPVGRPAPDPVVDDPWDDLTGEKRDGYLESARRQLDAHGGLGRVSDPDRVILAAARSSALRDAIVSARKARAAKGDP